jgi:hypothetical protein
MTAKQQKRDFIRTIRHQLAFFNPQISQQFINQVAKSNAEIKAKSAPTEKERERWQEVADLIKIKP